MSDDEKIIKCEITADTTPEEAKEMIEAIFNDEYMMRMLGGLAFPPSLGGSTEEAPVEVKLRRMQEAIDAFSQHPEIFDFSGYCGDSE